MVLVTFFLAEYKCQTPHPPKKDRNKGLRGYFGQGLRGRISVMAARVTETAGSIVSTVRKQSWMLVLSPLLG